MLLGPCSFSAAGGPVIAYPCTTVKQIWLLKSNWLSAQPRQFCANSGPLYMGHVPREEWLAALCSVVMKRIERYIKHACDRQRVHHANTPLCAGGTVLPVPGQMYQVPGTVGVNLINSFHSLQIRTHIHWHHICIRLSNVWISYSTHTFLHVTGWRQTPSASATLNPPLPAIQGNKKYTPITIMY